MAPEAAVAQKRIRFGWIPELSTAAGFSPTALTRRPILVRYSITWTAMTMATATYSRGLCSNSAGPTTGMSDKQRDGPGAQRCRRVEALQIRHHHLLGQEGRHPGRQADQHESGHHLWHPVPDGQDAEQCAPEHPADDGDDDADPGTTGDRGDQSGKKGADQELPLDGDVEGAGAFGEHSGRRPEDDRNRSADAECENPGQAGLLTAGGPGHQPDDARQHGDRQQHRPEPTAGVAVQSPLDENP